MDIRITNYKRKRDEKNTQDNNNSNITTLIYRRYPYIPILIALIVVISVLAISFGNYCAENNTSFTLIDRDGKEYIVFEIFNNKYVVKEYVEKTKKLKDRTTVFDIFDGDQIYQRKIEKLTVIKQ